MKQASETIPRAPLFVGEDIVDLTRTVREERVQKLFDARTFTASEQEGIQAAKNRTLVRWRLWSAKEASFKAMSKSRPDLPFNPARFEVTCVGKESAVVQHQAFVAHVSWTAHRDYVHCVALVGDAEQAIVRSQVLFDPSLGEAPQRESEAARWLAHAMIASNVSQPFELVHAACGSGPLLIRGSEAVAAAWDLSVSHDGSFVSATTCERSAANN